MNNEALPYTEEVVEDWQSIKNLSYDFSAYVYRGQADPGWPLISSLARALKRHEVDPEYWVSDEYWLIYEFKRRAHLYECNLPNDVLSWLALMQHHGAPTRLLDFTYSLYVACYFALIHAEGDSVVWMIDESWLRERCKVAGHTEGLSAVVDPLRDDDLRSIYEYGSSFLTKLHSSGRGRQEFPNKTESGVLIAEPEKQLRRLALQQGLFLLPLDLHKSIIENLLDTEFDIYQKNPGIIDRCRRLKKHVVKLILRKSVQEKALDELRSMNITAETLFPGMDGFAKSLIQIVIAT